MIVVVEGPDNAGKTTLAMFLAKQLRAAYVKVERPKAGVDLMRFQRILDVAEPYSGFVVADRHVAISEPIYGTIIRGGHQLPSADINWCLNQIDVIIYCRPAVDKIASSISDRPQMEGVVENTRAIVRAYDEYMLEVHLDQRHLLRRYDYENDKSEHLVQWLRQYHKAFGI